MMHGQKNIKLLWSL